MADNWLVIQTRNLDKIKEYISTLPRQLRGKATEAAGEYLIGNERRGLKHYPARVKHGRDNPYQWQTERQRRAYFASNGFGKGIPYQRTGDLANGWEQINSGVESRVVNEVPYAPFVIDEFQQVGHKEDGWRLVSQIISTNIAGMFQQIDRVLQDWINRNEPK